jgi:hypothetical protein
MKRFSIKEISSQIICPQDHWSILGQFGDGYDREIMQRISIGVPLYFFQGKVLEEYENVSPFISGFKGNEVEDENSIFWNNFIAGKFLLINHQIERSDVRKSLRKYSVTIERENEYLNQFFLSPQIFFLKRTDQNFTKFPPPQIKIFASNLDIEKSICLLEAE